MLAHDIHRRIDDYFINKLDSFGATPRGVDYSGIDAQIIRFEQLLKVIDWKAQFSILDYGCGYGALYELLDRQGWTFDYLGYDRIHSMIKTARERLGGASNAHFTSSEDALSEADYLVAGAIFNLKLDATSADWQESTLDTLNRMNTYCRRGFSFNMLTRYSDPDRMAERPDLFFGDPLFFFDFCKRHFSRNVALLHDYDLYDFTILVRK
jgi:SAM-dependent methyltransferase